jgi:hypothetical protein
MVVWWKNELLVVFECRRLYFRPSPTTAPLNPYGASSRTEAAVTDVPPGVLVLIIPTSLHFARDWKLTSRFHGKQA